MNIKFDLILRQANIFYIHENDALLIALYE